VPGNLVATKFLDSNTQGGGALKIGGRVRPFPPPLKRCRIPNKVKVDMDTIFSLRTRSHPNGLNEVVWQHSLN
jgi:hypothetical protein